ncbi:MAG: bifunctional phosphopantothenoylcysteine decarboxylase/phosphopantothenate--cysteine ligase CoaBC [Candidatus Caldarchaeum sp.]
MKDVIILGVTGSVSAYRSADLVRELLREGFQVRVCLTRAAQEFVSPTLFEALTGQPCLTHAFDEPVRGRMAHIDWARDARVVALCPATANAIATLAHGHAEDMLSTIISATEAHLVIAPAMNPQMYASPATQENLRILARRGALIVEPAEGEVACGESGQGKLAPINSIVHAIKRAAFRSHLYAGKKLLISAGSTIEPIDPVRYIANRSSGKMGYALAEAALKMGADVALISGPTHLLPPPRVQFFSFQTAEDLLQISLQKASNTDLYIGAAAVVDYRPMERAPFKIKREKARWELHLVETPDILKSLKERFPDLPLVGFSAETKPSREEAIRKIKEKGLSAIAVNDVSRQDIGFGADDNELTLYFASGESVHLNKDSKFNISVRLLELIHSMLFKTA